MGSEEFLFLSPCKPHHNSVYVGKSKQIKISLKVIKDYIRVGGVNFPGARGNSLRFNLI